MESELAPAILEAFQEEQKLNREKDENLVFSNMWLGSMFSHYGTHMINANSAKGKHLRKTLGSMYYPDVWKERDKERFKTEAQEREAKRELEWEIFGSLG